MSTGEAIQTGRPGRAVVNRGLFERLSATVVDLKPLPAGEWAILHEFREYPRQAYWFAYRLRQTFSKAEFTGSVESDGVGRLYARLAPAS